MRRIATVALGLSLVVALSTGTAIGVSRILDGSLMTTVGAPDGRPDVVATPTPRPTESETRTSTEPPRSTPEPSEEPSPDVDPVTWAQTRLTELHYYVAVVDGLAGPATHSAVMAFQKVNDLPRTGELDAATMLALESPRAPELRGGEHDRIEVDLDRQILVVVHDGEIARVLPVASGNGEGYTSSTGVWATANTPTGTFTVTRKILGERHAALGTLYNPLYFYRGFAVHGSTSVPAHEASHGCVRVTITDSVWLSSRIDVGTQVLVYGGVHVFPVS